MNGWVDGSMDGWMRTRQLAARLLTRPATVPSLHNFTQLNVIIIKAHPRVRRRAHQRRPPGGHGTQEEEEGVHGPIIPQYRALAVR